MKLYVITLLLLLSPGAFAEGKGKADSDRNVLSAVLAAADAYLVPGNSAGTGLYLTGGGLTALVGLAAFSDKTIHRGVGVSSSGVGSAFVLLGAFGLGKVNRKAMNENAFLKSELYTTLRKELGDTEARDFYQDLKAGVGIHRLVKNYSSGAISVVFLSFFRQEQKAVAGLIPPNITDRQHRLDLIDVIAARRAALRLVAQEASPSERERIQQVLDRDLEQLRTAAASASPIGGSGSPPDSPKTHD